MFFSPRSVRKRERERKVKKERRERENREKKKGGGGSPSLELYYCSTYKVEYRHITHTRSLTSHICTYIHITY